ncbi:MAG: hypothetical protein ACRC3B_22160, partial [Bacteroidia bacterium]
KNVSWCMTTALGFRQFFVRLWVWHVLLTLVFAGVWLVCFLNYTDFSARRPLAWANVIGFVAGTVHTLILLIISVRLLARNQWRNGLLFSLHFFVSSAIVYLLYISLIGAFFTALFH